jgi:hypothetical protein
MNKTVKDMKCGFCGATGHTARTCKEKKIQAVKEERKAKRKQAKKYYYSESKSLAPLLEKLTEEGKTALLNNGFMRSAHFLVQTKPETAIQELLIEPMIQTISTRAKSEKRKIEFSREPHFKTVDNKNKYLDYLLTVSFKGHKAPIKWLIEAEAPNQTHKGIEQVEDFLASVPNVNEYRFIVTDGYWYHFCLPTIDSALEWTSITIDDSSFWLDNKVSAMFLDIKALDSMKQAALFGSIMGAILIWNYLF